MKKAFVFVGTCLVTLLGLLTACTQSAGTSQEGGYKTMTVKKRKSSSHQQLFGGGEGKAECGNSSAGERHDY